MRYRKKQYTFGALRGVIYFLLPLVGLFSTALSPLPSSQSPSTAASSITATVAAVDTKARTLVVITGVGHALEVGRMQVPPPCKITVAGAPSQLGDLKRGNIVRIQYRKTADRNAAETIETIQLTPTGENR
jgi:hypothetical protein